MLEAEATSHCVLETAVGIWLRHWPQCYSANWNYKNKQKLFKFENIMFLVKVFLCWNEVVFWLFWNRCIYCNVNIIVHHTSYVINNQMLLLPKTISSSIFRDNAQLAPPEVTQHRTIHQKLSLSFWRVETKALLIFPKNAELTPLSQ